MQKSGAKLFVARRRPFLSRKRGERAGEPRIGTLRCGFREVLVYLPRHRCRPSHRYVITGLSATTDEEAEAPLFRGYLFF